MRSERQRPVGSRPTGHQGEQLDGATIACPLPSVERLASEVTREGRIGLAERDPMSSSPS
jgi:hypothetical protein